MKTLVVRACAIGDFVLNLPALQALYQTRPWNRFTLVGYPSTLELARQFISVEAIHSIEADPWRRLFFEPISGLDFDSATVWMKDSVVAQNLRFSGIPDVFRADPFPTPPDHAATHLLKTLNLSAPPLPDLWIPEERVILHPGSGSLHKCWLHFEELAARLDKAVILVGPNETNFRTRHTRLENLTLSDVSRELRQCRALIGNDSGITHLGAYLGCPTVALFGPTDPRIWGPTGRRARTIWKKNLEDISVDEVLEALIRGDARWQHRASPQ